MNPSWHRRRHNATGITYPDPLLSSVYVTAPSTPNFLVDNGGPDRTKEYHARYVEPGGRISSHGTLLVTDPELKVLPDRDKHPISQVSWMSDFVGTKDEGTYFLRK